MKKGSNLAVVFTTACMITGNLIGAGILGLPINTGLAGFIPALAAMMAGGAMMYFTAIILGKQVELNRDKESFDYPSLYQRYLGGIGKWIAIAANIIILYGLLTAYFTGGAKVLSSFLGLGSDNVSVFLVFASILIIMTCINLSVIQRLNTLFIIFLAGAFSVLTFIGATHMEIDRMGYLDWKFLPATLPIIVTAFHFHNIIPVMITSLDYDMKTFRRSVILGMLLAFIMNMLWVAVGIGVLPLTGENSILNAFHTNLPATVPMGAQLKSTVFTVVAALFAIVAICTSFLANGVGLMNFIKDLLKGSGHPGGKPVVAGLAFAPPLLTAFFYPDIFLKALNVVGGVGIITLFGILPSAITLMNRAAGKTARAVAAAVLVFASLVLVVEVMQETGFLKLHPDVEYHQTNFGHK